MSDTEIEAVIFRCDRDGSHVTAVFPELPADVAGHHMTCFEHVGQHSGCTMGWYQTTRPATPDEYANLKAELESAPYEYRLRVYKRITPTMRKALRENAR